MQIEKNLKIYIFDTKFGRNSDDAKIKQQRKVNGFHVCLIKALTS